MSVEFPPLALDEVTFDEGMSMPCITCFAFERELCVDDKGRRSGVTHIERIDWAARFYGEFLARDQERLEV